MRLSSLSLTFLPTPSGLSGRPGPGRPSGKASSSAMAAPGPLTLTLDDDGLGDGSQCARGVSNGRRDRRAPAQEAPRASISGNPPVPYEGMTRLFINRGRRTLPPMRTIDLYSDVLPVALFRRLSRSVRAVGTERLENSYRTNFWFALDAPPRNVVEEAIVRLWRVVRPGPRCIGAEWWLGRLAYGQSLPMHFDRDMTLERRTGQVAHPLWSSILYLNRFPSSPTVILDQVLGRDRRSLVP